MVEAVKSGDWDRAADEMLWGNGLKKQRRSKWYKQTPNRCQDAADKMRHGSTTPAKQMEEMPTELREGPELADKDFISQRFDDLEGKLDQLLSRLE